MVLLSASQAQGPKFYPQYPPKKEEEEEEGEEEEEEEEEGEEKEVACPKGYINIKSSSSCYYLSL